jgi:hypothetical protein
MGQEVIVQATATDSKGVTQVELSVNGVLYHSDVSPSPQGQSPFISRQSWRAPAPGTYTLMVKAYNAAGGVSQPAAITVNVPGAVTLTPGQPTATPTVTSTPAPGTPTVTSTPVGMTETPTVCTFDAAFVADVTVPDGTVFAPGASIDKIWRIRNSGSCPWESGSTWVFVSGDQMGAAPSQAVPATAVGGNVDIGVTMYAPSAPGTYTGYWRMKSPDGQVFGQTCSVEIVVPAPATATPTSTATPTATATPTVTPTPTATSTQPPPSPPIIEFTVDDDSITAGDCTTLRVHIENVQAAHLNGAEYTDSAVTGPHWSGSTCPASTTTYTLHVIKLDSSTEDKTVTINVTPAGPPPIHSTGLATIPGTWTFDLDEGVIGPAAGEDFWWEIISASAHERSLVPRNGATYSIRGPQDLEDVDYSECDGATYSGATIQANQAGPNQIPGNTVVCYRTSEGRTGKFRVEGYVGGMNNDLRIRWTTWD